MPASDRYNRVGEYLTVDDLSEHIDKWKKQGFGKARFLAFDADSNGPEYITGFILSLEEMTIEVQTDEP